jgi:hypothetical protein
MGLSAEVTVIPGPVDPDTGSPSPEPPYEGALEDFLATPGVAGTEVETVLNQTLLQATQETAEGLGWWDNIRQFFARENHTVVAEGEQVVELEGYWMILPEVPGASVSLTVSLSSSNEKSASFMIAGTGGGPAFTIGLKEGLSHQAAVCERITLTAVGVFQKIEVSKDNAVIGTYPRLASLDTDNLSWRFSPAAPPAAALLGNAFSTTRFDASTAAGTTTPTLEITQGTTWDVSAGIDLPNIGGIKAQISAKIKYEHGVKFEYSLPGGHLYTASRYQNLPAYLWTFS